MCLSFNTLNSGSSHQIQFNHSSSTFIERCDFLPCQSLYNISFTLLICNHISRSPVVHHQRLPTNAPSTAAFFVQAAIPWKGIVVKPTL